MLNAILYVLAVMLFYDFSIHVIELFGLVPKFLNSRSLFSYYYPHFKYRKIPNGIQERSDWGLFYQRFWVAYWGIAFILLVVYIILK